MKNKTLTKIMNTGMLIMISMAFLGGCGQEGENPNNSSSGQQSVDAEISSNVGEERITGRNSNSETNSTAEAVERAGADQSVGADAGSGTDSAAEADAETDKTSGTVTELEVRFGDEGEPFLMQLEDNETAKAIARYVGTSDWRLPIYERDDDADYNVLQYYDISSRYDIPSAPVTVTTEKAGEVYYSDPNRIVLFYHDAEITGEYTKIGTFDATDAFVNAVEENPILEGWGNKIVQIAQP